MLAFFRSPDPDYWFHLAAGRSILQHGIPSHEIWSLSGQGGRPALSEWLFHVALYGVHALGGKVAVAAWRMAWAALAAALAVALLKKVGAATWVAALLLVAAQAAGRARMEASPEQLFPCFLLLELWVLEAARRGGKNWSLALLPVQVLWANMLPSWIFGPMACSVYAAAEMVRARTENASARRAIQWMGLSVALVLVSAISPRPAETLSLPLAYLQRSGGSLMNRGIEELQPWSWAAQKSAPFTLLLGAALLGLIFGARRALREAPALTLLGVLFLALGVHAQRFQAAAALVALPGLALALLPGPQAYRRVACLAAAGLVAAAALVWVARTWTAYPIGAQPQLGDVPVAAVARANQLHLSGPAFNSLEFGGYLLWARGDSHAPLVDGRGVGTAEFQSQLVRAHFQRSAFDSLRAAWHFTHALVRPQQSREDQAAAWFAADRTWRVIFMDDVAALLARTDQIPEAARGRVYRALTPDISTLERECSAAKADSVLRDVLEGELQRARAESPENSWTAGYFLGTLELNCGRPDRALEAFTELGRRFPKRHGWALLKGATLIQLHRPAEARVALTRALRDPADAGEAQRALDGLVNAHP